MSSTWFETQQEERILLLNVLDPRKVGKESFYGFLEARWAARDHSLLLGKDIFGGTPT